MRNLLLAGAAALLVAAGATAAPATGADDPVQLSIRATSPGSRIDRHIFGQFAEHLGYGIYDGIWVGKDSAIPNTRGIRKDVVAALKALQVPVVRWPGGCFADEYHWRRGIGPANKRQPMMNSNWGGVGEPNSFGTDEFMDFIQQIGSEAYVSVNVGSGTPGEAAEWAEYMTAPQSDAIGQERAANGHPEPYKLAYLGLGNESWGCGGAMSADYYVSQMKLYSRFVHNYNPAQTMQRIAVGPDAANTAYTEAVMSAWAQKVWSWDIEGISMHTYTTGGWPPAYKATPFGEGEYATLLKETLGMDTMIRKHVAIMDKYDPQKKVALVIDEWGAWLAPTEGSPKGFLVQQNSQRDAVLAALNLNIFARHADRVRMANIAQMINVLQAMVLTDKEKMLLTPTYHVFHMYVPFQDATFLPVTFNAGEYRFDKIRLPRVDSIAARDKNGKIWIALTNVDPGKPVRIEIATAGLNVSQAKGETLSAPAIDSVNTFEKPTTIAPKAMVAQAAAGRITVTLAPASVTVLSLEP